MTSLIKNVMSVALHTHHAKIDIMCVFVFGCLEISTSQLISRYAIKKFIDSK